MKGKKVQLLVILMAIAFLICACSDPKDTILPPDINSWKSDQKFTKSIEKLPEDEKKLLASYAMRATLAGSFGGQGIKEGTTIGQAINIQKQWQEEREKEKEKQRILAEELKQQQLARLKEMNEALTVTLLSLKFKTKKYQNYFSIQVGFKNNTTENISGAKGVVILKDMFGEIIKQINLSNDSGIPANNTMTYSGSIDFNQFMDNDKKLKSTEFEKLQFEWMPNVYIFESGKKLTMPQM